MLSRCFLDFSVGVKAFVMGLIQKETSTKMYTPFLIGLN